MKKTTKSLLFRIIRDERGQIVPMMAAGLLIAMFGLTAISIDLGNVYLAYQQLQASTNAAALAGAQALPNTTATTQATHYSSTSGGLNAYTNLPGVTMVSGYPKIECLTTLENEGLPCYSPANGNAVQVQQKVNVKLYFASLLGAPPIPLTATSTAAARGADAGPFNVAIIIDTTASMNQADGTSECSGSRLSCSLSGLQTLLLELAPCEAQVTTCSVSNGIAQNSVDNVSLFTFPNMTTTTVTDDTNCSGTNPKIEPYDFPSSTGTTYSSTPEIAGGTTYNMTYQVTSYVSDYRTGDTSTSLNASSVLSKAAGAGGSHCPAVEAPGGDGTYYAGAIYAAQASLQAEQVIYPKASNVIILLSDGDATSTKSQMVNSTTQVPAGGLIATASGTYPSWNKECQQAVTAAQYAAAQGTRIYAVAYGPEPGACNNGSGGDTLTPCQTMQAIASAPQFFFTDVNQAGSASCSSVNKTTNLQGIFSAIGADFTYARLIPNATT